MDEHFQSVFCTVFVGTKSEHEDDGHVSGFVQTSDWSPDNPNSFCWKPIHRRKFCSIQNPTSFTSLWILLLILLNDCREQKVGTQFQILWNLFSWGEHWNCGPGFCVSCFLLQFSVSPSPDDHFMLLLLVLLVSWVKDTWIKANFQNVFRRWDFFAEKGSFIQNQEPDSEWAACILLVKFQTLFHDGTSPFMKWFILIRYRIIFFVCHCIQLEKRRKFALDSSFELCTAFSKEWSNLFIFIHSLHFVSFAPKTSFPLPFNHKWTGNRIESETVSIHGKGNFIWTWQRWIGSSSSLLLIDVTISVFYENNLWKLFARDGWTHKFSYRFWNRGEWELNWRSWK